MALSTVQQIAYAQAQRDFRSGRRAAAYGAFARLADAGRSPSAQRRRWNALVVNAARGRLDVEDNERGD